MRKILFGTLGWVFLSASILFMLFVVLSGVTHSTPLRKIYFLQADTSSISNARPISRWTYFYICGADNYDCGNAHAALPFGYAWEGGGSGAPLALIGNHAKHTTSTHFYYLWRFGWVFYLMGLTFAVLGFITGCLYCVRILNKITGLLLTFGLFWFTLGASLMNAEFIQARDKFHSAGISAHVGKYAFGFSWAAWACLQLAVIFFFHAGRKDYFTSRREKRKDRRSVGSNIPPINGMGPSKGRFGIRWPRKHQRDSILDKETV